MGVRPRPLFLSHEFRRCLTLPHPSECSTISAVGLSYRVRDGTGRFPHAITTGNPATNPRTSYLRCVRGGETMRVPCSWTKLYSVTNHFTLTHPVSAVARLGGGGLLVVNHMVDASTTRFFDT